MPKSYQSQGQDSCMGWGWSLRICALGTSRLLCPSYSGACPEPDLVGVAAQVRPSVLGLRVRLQVYLMRVHIPGDVQMCECIYVCKHTWIYMHADTCVRSSVPVRAGEYSTHVRGKADVTAP